MDTGKDTINALGAFAAIAGMAGTLCFAALAGMRLAQGLHPEAAINGTLAVAAAIATWRCIRTAREDWLLTDRQETTDMEATTMTTTTTTAQAAFTPADLARAAAELARDIARASWDWGDRPGEWTADGEAEWEGDGGTLRAEMGWSVAETVTFDHACGCAETTSRRLWLDATLLAWDEAADEWRDITTPGAVAAIRDAAEAALD